MPVTEPAGYSYGPESLPEPGSGPWTMWRYRRLLPLGDGPIRYALPVGGTPLLGPAGLRARLGLPRLWLKDETWGPSASNKDRATALVIEAGLRAGAKTITTSSTGNAALATAIGAAAAALRAVIFVPIGCGAAKVELMRVFGADVVRVREGYRAAFDLSREAVARFGWLDRNTGVNPLTLEGKKTVAFEIWEQLGAAPEVVLVPVGDGPTLVGLAIGFRELAACGVIPAPPRLIGVQAAGCCPLVHAWSGRGGPPPPVLGTIADGIDVPEPSIGERAVAEVRAGGGAFVAVTDDEMVTAMGELASFAGIGAEAAGAAATAGLRVALAQGLVDPAETAVALVTGRELSASEGIAPPGRLLTVNADAPGLWAELAALGEARAVAR
ncbi:threonine synthase [Amycolatopsis magusensis]|uniref:Threonine synthase n=1 Tax=Amycolatopsis magusensis TaxID=882444 RepID=A0ABS4PXI6_9PSEU|nr:pyridoxal-phosphate dependent enzyme [Amycolatopsis magusensis]MBP2183590.1 threonine synthase [Amycolatopsis magusensis]